MLILTRKKGQNIFINDEITVRVVQIKQGQVRIGIEAPDEYKILREEVKLRKQVEVAK